MSMIPYHSLLEVSESDLVTSFQVADNCRGMPNGKYAFVPYYCNRTNCDCREVWVEVILTEISDDGQIRFLGESLAFIDYGWEKREFYAGSQTGSSNLIDFPGAYLDVENSPSEHARTILEVFKYTIQNNDDFRSRLEEQYYDFKFRLKERTIKERTINENAEQISLPMDFQPPSFLPSFRKKRMKLR